MMLSQVIEKSEIIGKTVTQQFDIGDQAMIIEFMSKTIYSNPLKIVVQEYISNARDAHIEIGKGDIPVKVKLPNRFDPTLSFRDFGPGISPDRMKNVFIRYGVSTKRNNNNESGSFGLGAKSWIAYTDSFNIRTIAKENGELTLRNYSVIKERGLSPRLVEFGDPTVIDINDPGIPDEDKQTGTTISANIKPEDFESIAQNLISITEFWKVRPLIIGSANTIPQYKNIKWAYEGTNWKISNDRSYYTESFVCIDGIPYPLNREAVIKHCKDVNGSTYDLIRTQFALFFNVGELSVSLNREQLHYDDMTINAILNRLEEMKQWLTVNIQTQIETAASYWDANCLYNQMNSTFNFNFAKLNISWNGTKILGGEIQIVNGMCKAYFMDNGKIRSKRKFNIPFGHNITLVLNDEPKVFQGKIATLIEANPNNNVYVVTPDDITSWNLKVNFNACNPIKLSTVIKKTLPKPSFGSMSKVNVVRYNIREVKTVNQSSMFYKTVNYKTDSGYYVITDRLTNDSVLNDVSDIREFLKEMVLTDDIYFIPKKYTNKIKANKNFIHLNVLISKTISSTISNKEYLDYVKYSNDSSYTMNTFCSGIFNLIEKNKDLLEDNIIKKWFNISEKIITINNKLNEKFQFIKNIQNKLKNNQTNDITEDSELKTIYNTYNDKLKSINNYVIRDPSYWNNSYYISLKNNEIAVISKAFMDILNGLFKETV